MSDQEQCAQALPDRRSWLARKRQEFAEGIRWHGYLLYCRTLYRPHMRLWHRFGWCQMKHMQPIGGPDHYWCQWCGMRGRK